ncbi:hypothetical protein GCM10008018_59100 [Paenibacillus marchantiophytorum]|uniref:GIY-YIG domain-containing protein n=1 Tax=Paenibacillus marchantiophytorum TaxID=1619310 RepID=A0ABQ1FC87_9BACL|nr:hypothetical protein [Paenibacillus marchantiophytorum]GGA05209.1 hypothetical protein GCM10008018_59100 [Paenibacillus marchantiophytorum]
MQNLVELEFDWLPIHAEMNQEYFYPAPQNSYMRKLYKTASVYRWKVHRHSEECKTVYIGETNNFSNRLNGYLKPGTSQMTNIRMKSLFDEFLSNKYLVTIEIMSIKKLQINSKPYSQLDLTNTSLRRLIENLLLIDHRDQGYEILNA